MLSRHHPSSAGADSDPALNLKLNPPGKIISLKICQFAFALGWVNRTNSLVSSFPSARKIPFYGYRVMSARTALQDMKDGKFVRKDATHRTKIVEPELNRYHLYISMACPWANGCLAALKMKGLEDVIGWSNTHPTWQKTRPHDENDVSKLVWCVYHCPTLIAHCIHTPLASSSFACRRVTVGGASGRRAMRL